MDCNEAQRIVSERLDDETLDSEQVALAKAHCRGCRECGAYVRALVQIQRLSLPQPPADLPDRVMAAVRAEAQRAAQPTAEPVEEREEAPVSAEPVSPPGFGSSFLAYVTAPQNRRAVTIWGAAAATLFVVASVTAIGGLRQITADPSASRQAAEQVGSGDLSAMSAAPESAAQDGFGSAPSVEPASAAPNYVVVSGVVYVATGPVSGVETSTLTPVGATRTSLSVGGAPASRQVLGLGDPARVYIVDDAGELLGFDRVTRRYRNATYALSSGELLTYGLWATLPAGVDQPTNPNGMPEYVSAGADELGVEVFRPTAGGTDSGFAVAPGTPASDPAAGNPGWTWWIPAR